MAAPAETNRECLFLEWDSIFFGFRIGRVESTTLTESSLASVIEWARTQKIRCLYFAADGQSPETMGLAARGGFQFVDVRLDLGCVPTEARESTETMGIRSARLDDLPTLQQIARVSHHDTRFFKDLGFPRARAEDLYAEWIRRDQQVHTVFVATAPGADDPVGYITCQIDRASKAGRIGLLAVAASHSGRGAGRALVNSALGWFAAQGCLTAMVATQSSNIPAQRLYQATGFRTRESTVWFHRWFYTGEMK